MWVLAQAPVETRPGGTMEPSRHQRIVAVVEVAEATKWWKSHDSFVRWMDDESSIPQDGSIS